MSRSVAGQDDILPSQVAEQLVSITNPTSVAADQYRAMCHNLDNLRTAGDLQVIGVTSPSPGDGKTVTTLNLAAALARDDGARVLVVDADLRRASVASYLGLRSRPGRGLADALRDTRCELGDVTRRVQDLNLWVVPGGAPDPAPYELLNSNRFQTLVQEARRGFSHVLIDTPPCVLMPDCRLIEQWVDGFVLVIAAHKTPRRLVSEALNELDRAKMLGVIFNADDRAGSKYYGYSGSYYDAPAGGRRNRAWWRRLTGAR